MTSFRFLGSLCLGMSLTATGLSDHNRVDRYEGGRANSRADLCSHGNVRSYQVARYSRCAYQPCFVRPYSYAHWTYGYPGFEKGRGVSYHFVETYPQCGPTVSYASRTRSVTTRSVTGSGSLGLEVQSALQELGFYQGAIDGDVGPETRAAIRAYQAENGLGVTGRIDAGLLRLLEVG